MLQAARHKASEVTVLERLCTRCEQTKSHVEFHRKASGPGGLQPHCIACMKASAVCALCPVPSAICLPKLVLIQCRIGWGNFLGWNFKITRLF